MAQRWIAQPARRMAIAWSAVGALVGLALLCATPNWSSIHLLDAPPTVINDAPRIIAPPTQSITAQQPREAVPNFAAQQLPTIETTPLAVAEPHPIDWSRITTLTIACGSVIVLLWLTLGARQVSRLCATAEAPPEHITVSSQPLAVVGSFACVQLRHEQFRRCGDAEGDRGASGLGG
ncbi:MAG: hypothetical protein ACC683_12475, partial [Acidimicrobiia bacterium]